jgi:hypothetical protein
MLRSGPRPTPRRRERAAVHCTVLGDRLSDVAVYEEYLDVMAAFWA